MTTTADRIFALARESGIEPRSIRSTLAKVCGISPQAVRDWEFGTTKNLKHDHLVALSDYFGVNLHWLLTGEGSRDQPATTEDAEQILRRWSSLTPEQRAMVLRMIDAVASDPEAE